MQMQSRTKIRSLNIPYRKSVVRVYGGPYMQRPDNIKGVKMAKEINMPCDVRVDTADFNVPEKGALINGLLRGAEILALEDQIFVGCMGGVGRTGLYMACLAKAFDAAENTAIASERVEAETNRRAKRKWYQKLFAKIGGEPSLLDYQANLLKDLKYYGSFDPVSFVRANYNPHAVETRQQQLFVDELDVSMVAEHINSLYASGEFKRKIL